MYTTSFNAFVKKQFKTMTVDVVGVDFNGSQAVIAQVAEGETIRLQREPDNPSDPEAIRVERQEGSQLGYLPYWLVQWLAPEWDDRGVTRSTAKVIQRTGGYDPYSSLGLQIQIDFQSEIT